MPVLVNGAPEHYFSKTYLRGQRITRRTGRPLPKEQKRRGRSSASAVRWMRVLAPDYIQDAAYCLWLMHNHENEETRHRCEVPPTLGELLAQVIEVWCVDRVPVVFGMPLGKFRELRAAGYSLAEVVRYGRQSSALGRRAA